MAFMHLTMCEIYFIVVCNILYLQVNLRNIFGVVMELVANRYLPTELFTKKLTSLEKMNHVGYVRVSKVIDRLLIQPQNSDGIMKGIYDGRLKKYVGKKDFRIIYHWCKQCRQEKMFRVKEKCVGCDEMKDNSVIFFDLYHKSDMKKLHD